MPAPAFSGGLRSQPADRCQALPKANSAYHKAPNAKYAIVATITANQFRSPSTVKLMSVSRGDQGDLASRGARSPLLPEGKDDAGQQQAGEVVAGADRDGGHRGGFRRVEHAGDRQDRRGQP